jgi:hypothetical protein
MYNINVKNSILEMKYQGEEIEIFDFLSIDIGESPIRNEMIVSKNGKDFIVIPKGVTEPIELQISFVVDDEEDLEKFIDYELSVVDFNISNTKTKKVLKLDCGLVIKCDIEDTKETDYKKITLFIQTPVNSLTYE